jgi:outer membrane protein assembly factor BamB
MPAMAHPRVAWLTTFAVGMCCSPAACKPEPARSKPDRAAQTRADEPAKPPPQRPAKPPPPRPTGSEIFDHVLGSDQLTSVAKLVVALPDGAFVAIGAATPKPGINSQPHLVRFDALGVTDWDQLPADMEDLLPAAAAADGADLYLGLDGFSDRRPWLARFDPRTGSRAWSKPVHDKDCRVKGLTVLDSDLLLVGACQTMTDPRRHPWVGRFDREGARLWISDLGGDPDVELNAVTVEAEHIIVVGADGSKPELNFEAYVGWLDHQGALVRSETFGGDGPQHFSSVVASPSGLVVGGFTGVVGEVSRRWAWALGLSPSGRERWRFETPDEPGKINRVVETDDGVLLLGHSGESIHGQAWIVRLDSDGKQQWKRTYGATEYGTLFDAAILPDQRIVAVGGQPIRAGSIDYGLWFMSVDENGEPAGAAEARRPESKGR